MWVGIEGSRLSKTAGFGGTMLSISYLLGLILDSSRQAPVGGEGWGGGAGPAPFQGKFQCSLMVVFRYTSS